MNQRSLPLTRAPGLALTIGLFAAACSKGGSAPTGTTAGGDFVVTETQPANNGRVFLNDPIQLDFSNRIDLDTADHNAIRFLVLDENLEPTAESVVGTFRLARAEGDEAIGRRLEFVPAIPTNESYDDGGFPPGRTIIMSLVGGDPRNGAVLRDADGKGLAIPRSLQFSVADGTTPAQLFRDVVPGGPARVAFSVSPTLDGGAATLNQLGQADVEVRLTFDQPLNPVPDNVPVALDTDPLRRGEVDRGRIYMIYDDPALGADRWIPATVELEVNDLERAVVVLRPVGVLPNNAEIRVIVEDTLEDLSGESNAGNTSYDPVFATFRTDASYGLQFDAVVEEFDSRDAFDLGATFVEPLARIGRGFVASSLEFGGQSTILDYEPNQREVILNTDFVTIQPRNGLPFNVSGGRFNFNNVTIPAGVEVRGTGSRPMVWYASGDFIVGGTLSVRGGDGDRVNTLNSANFPAAGGIGQCGGGNGGRGSPSSTTRSATGEAGFGPGQIPGGGGQPGRLACVAGCPRGSGGGGGSFATRGDPWYLRTGFAGVEGRGGQSCAAVAGGQPGPLGFDDARTDNDFWGVGVDRNVNRQARIVGELEAIRGGAGGGGGGDGAPSCIIQDPGFRTNDDKGGGGGGGGGALVIQALGRITVLADGRITADGGHGGGGEQAGSSDEAGGGGAGSGGMVVLMAGGGIEIHTHGETYAQNDFDFAISADGGVTRTGTYTRTGGVIVSDKYPAVPAGYNNFPLGGFGGMGVVQLMAPVGENADNTNTALDDSIDVVRNGMPLSGGEKQRFLAWRGIDGRDDSDQVVAIGDDEGDIRPSPHLLPAPFGPRTRIRSKWIDTGATVRRSLASGDGQPRGVIDPSGSRSGPTYEFAGLDPNGFVAYTGQQGSDLVDVNQPAVLASPARVDSIEASASYLGEAAYRIALADDVLGAVENRYAHYQAELLDPAGTTVGSFRILAHTARSLVLAADDPLPGNAARLQVRAKFFGVAVDGVEGLGTTYAGINGQRVPTANVRIGFAFHQDPADPTASRYPANPNEFVYDLSDPAVQTALADPATAPYPFVLYDVIFDVAWQSTTGDPAPRLTSESPTIQLNFLRLPTRY